MKDKTKADFFNIIARIKADCSESEIKTAIFRYSKDYKDTFFDNNRELLADVAIDQYEKYLKWKGVQNG